MTLEFIEISEDGKITVFHDSKYAKKIKHIEKIERVSHIVPANPILRIIFKLLRKLFGDEGKIADWTRTWKCKWKIELILPEFDDRQKAIEYEKKLISIIRKEL